LEDDNEQENYLHSLYETYITKHVAEEFLYFFGSFLTARLFRQFEAPDTLPPGMKEFFKMYEHWL
jgi:hypothetical protein